jgi:hypothetical protein
MKLLTNPSVIIIFQYEYQCITLYTLHFTQYYMSIISVKLKNGAATVYTIAGGTGEFRRKKKEEGTSWKERGRAHLAENVTQEIEDKLCFVCVCVCVCACVCVCVCVSQRRQ